MKKQSSVDWLSEEIDNMISFIDVETSINFKRIIEQAKAMHKKEIMNAYVYGAAYQIDIKNGLSPIVYFNEIFEK